MKKIVGTILLCLFIFSLTFVFNGCNSDNCGCNSNKDDPNTKERLILNYNSYTLFQYEGFNLSSSNYNDVEFSSENEQIVKVDSNGYVFALNVGSTSVVVKSGELSSKCLVTVLENGIKPYIATNVDEFNLHVDDEFAVEPKLYFSSLSEDAVFTYETDSDCITVDGSGLVKAVKPGDAGLIIKSKFYNVEVIKIVNVRVVENINVYVDRNSFSIMKNNSLGGEISFAVSGISVYNGDELIANAETYYSFDETLLSRAGNVFTSLNTNGKTVDENTTVNVCYDYNGSTFYCIVNVEIKFPIKDERGKTVYYVDNWKDCQKVESKGIGKESFMFDYDIFGGEDVKNISTVINGAYVDLAYNEGLLGVENLAKGNFVWKVCNKDYGSLIDVSVVDYVCFDSRGFEKIVSVATDETIVLANDILDFGLLTRVNQNTFSGILDGNGHKIVNMRLGEMTGGIFYNCNGAVIKNLSLLNVESTARFGTGVEAREYVRGIIASTLSNTKLVNICIDAFSNSSCIEGVLAYRISQGVSVQNVVINYKTVYEVHGQTASLCYMMDSMFSEADGLFVICPDTVDLVEKQLQYVDKKEVITTDAFKTVQEMYDFFGVDGSDYLIGRYKNSSFLKYDLEETELADIFDELWENY